MKRVAVIGGGISGLAAAYELELARKAGAAIDWHLYEATDRLGGIVETTRHQTEDGEWILEGGPDAWVSEKPWARELAIELGLESELIFSNDNTRKTYIYLDGRLQAMPDRMRMMVPEDLATLDSSPLFSAAAKQAYADELTRAEELRAGSPFVDPAHDESVATFVLRHFGNEVLDKIAAPLLSGVFGGDVHRLSVRAGMAPFVSMEQEHGSLILALQTRRQERGDKPPQPVFTSLRRGLASLVESLVAKLPSERLHLGKAVHEISCEDDEWTIWFPRNKLATRGSLQPIGSLSAPAAVKTAPSHPFNAVYLATPLHETRKLLHDLDPVSTTLLPSSGSAVSLLPAQASSAVLASFTWPAEQAHKLQLPQGFGFLVPQSGAAAPGGEPELLACTFVDQKFAHRAPPGGKILRAFFGGVSAEFFAPRPDEAVAHAALEQLRKLLGPLPAPAHSVVCRWPRSLPQYEVGHLHRMAELDRLVAQWGGSLTLLGNSYRGVGLPDLIRDARAAARSIAGSS